MSDEGDEIEVSLHEDDFLEEDNDVDDQGGEKGTSHVPSNKGIEAEAISSTISPGSGFPDF